MTRATLLMLPLLVAAGLYAGLSRAAEPPSRTTAGPMAAAPAFSLSADREPAVAQSDVIVFSAPPRDNEEEGRKRFEPVAEYLTKVVGKKVVYKHPGSWGVYQGAMQKGAYDLVFDGPHFSGWRMEKLGYAVLLKIPGDFSQSVFVRKDNTAVTDVRQLAGRTVCAHPPPNLGTLVLLGALDNPVRQPVIVPMDGYEHIYQALLADKCVAAVVPAKHLEKFDRDRRATRIVFKSRPLPNQALSAGPRVTRADQARIVEALLAPEAVAPTAKLREAYGVGKGFVPATNGEYVGLGAYLRNEWGYY